MNRLVWLFTAIIVLNGTVASAGEWIADTRTFCLVWNENPQSDQRVLWSGDCAVADIAKGPGVVQWILDGEKTDRFKGSLVNGRRQGKGTMQWADGGSYDGAWRSDKRDGRGVMVWPDGSRYEGDWSNDRRSGRGIMAWADGQHYKGRWRDDQPHGSGTMKWADGTGFEGPFYKGKPNGKGKCTTAGGERSRCKYKSGVLVE
ncbi:MAG: hypothetical protein O7G13_14900 [Alphaproteobacteria bacterium]|nr:hypothetical protein [Alphaproteobacteria bacterium]